MTWVRELIESLKYANHIWPIVILRFYVGGFFIVSSLQKTAAGYLERPLLSAAIDENLFVSGAAELPQWISFFYMNWVQNNWQVWAKLFVSLEWALGLFLLLGFLVRPVSLVLVSYVYLVSHIMAHSEWSSHSQVLIMLGVICVFGAGRVFGVDYLFYKRQRGWIW